MSKIIYFDISALFILIPIIPAMIRKHMNHGSTNRHFFAFCGIVLAATISDIWAVSLDLMGPGHVVPKYIAHTLYLVFRSLVTPVCISFLFARVGLWYRYKDYKKALKIYFAPACVPIFLLLFVNPFRHVMFYLGEGDAYTRGTLMIVMYVVSFAYAFGGYYVLIHHGKLIGYRKTIYLLLVFTLVLLATVFQFFFPNILLENFSISIAALIVALGIQAPEERVYGHSAFLKISAFVDDMRSADEMGTNVGLVLLSITNFDTLRQMLGLDAMESCMDIITENINSIRRETTGDLDCYYLTGGQFVFSLKNARDGELNKLADRINDIMHDDISVGVVNVKFNANLCMVEYPADIDKVSDIIPFIESLKRKDYTGKVRLAKDEFDRRYYEIRRRIEEIVDRAFEKNTLSLVYQPIYSVDKERYVALEAFLRLDDPEFGIISPEHFIREAERCGAIHGVTTYLFEQVCDFISGPEFMQLNLKWIELNLSPIQCMWTDLVSVVTSLLDSYGVDPDLICFNIVDNDNAKFSERMYENLELLSDLGIHIYMDDFGAGVFEIERINSLPLEGIKLDRNFIRTSVESDSMLILENSVRMIRDMGLEAVAVGVEDLSVRRRLVEMGCLTQQGYYYAPPKEKRELIRYMVGLPGVAL